MYPSFLVYGQQICRQTTEPVHTVVSAQRIENLSRTFDVTANRFRFCQCRSQLWLAPFQSIGAIVGMAMTSMSSDHHVIILRSLLVLTPMWDHYNVLAENGWFSIVAAADYRCKHEKTNVASLITIREKLTICLTFGPLQNNQTEAESMKLEKMFNVETERGASAHKLASVNDVNITQSNDTSQR